jgi:putative phage-type endonuclease
MVEQKSEAWHNLRKNLITASDFAQALGQGKFGNQTDIIKKKVRPNEDPQAFNNPFFKWGNTFECVATNIYSMLHFGVKIHDFGLIPHKKLNFFGASPDGISEIGIMLEIKCPYRRKIEKGGEVPKQYYYQIQGQLEVCDLKECDYFECQFHQYTTAEELFTNFADDRFKGIVIEYPSATGDGTYHRYSPIASSQYGQVSLEEMRQWLDTNTDEDFVDIKFWYLSHFNLQRVVLDKPFVDEKLKDLKQVWDRITYYRENPTKYDLEILKTFDIGVTSRLKPLPPSKGTRNDKKNEKNTLSGYSFLEDPTE